MKHLLLLAILMVFAVGVRAQGRISGKVIDASTSEPVEYATVSILNVNDSALVNGAVTSGNGSFTVNVPYGRYLVRISFMGFATYFHPSVAAVSETRPALNIGKVKLSQSATMLQAAVVSAERSMVEYQLDKRVINVDKNIVTGGGTATDILENVPSVAIDNDGNVTLRGSTNVKVLIDGRPYELLSSDLESLLEQIPASSVENVEVITNPSAKYDPEGMSGIINIKLKDKSKGALGLNGTVSLNAGTPLPFMIPDFMPQVIPTTMGTVNLNYTTPKYNIFFNADAGQRSRANVANSRIQRKRNGTVISDDTLSSGSVNTHYMGSFKVGGEYYFNDKNSLLVAYQFRVGNRRKESQVDANDLLGNGLLDYHQADTNNTYRINHNINLLYTKKFSRKDQLLTFDITHSTRHAWSSGWQEQTYFGDALWDNYYLRTSETDRHHPNTDIRLNYTHPFANGWRLETGYEGQIVSTEQDYNYWYSTYDTLHNLNKVRDDNSSTHFISYQNIHAVYATFGGSIFKNCTAQAGLRGEYSNIGGRDENHPATKPIDKEYWQLYPTLHLSYEINKDQSVQLSYSRRVRRPRMWDINPYIDVREGREMSFGNPGLAPEFTNAFECSYNLGVGKSNIFVSAYYRQTDSMMTRYGFVWDAASVAYYSPWMNYDSEYDGYWASTWQNLNKGRNYGLELIVDHQLAKWWKVNVSVNLYESMIEGSELLGGGDTSAFRASGKLNSYMTLPHDWTIQFSGQYRAPFFDLQTDILASYWFDLAVKKDLWQKRATLNLRIGDVFCTGGFGHITDSPQLYRTVHARRLSPTVTLGFSYKINNGLKSTRRSNGDDDEGGGNGYGDY